jgi:N-acetyl-anhydromuramyl-L-alanine amidase AmpD
MVNIFKFVFVAAIFSYLPVSAQNISESELAVTKREDWNANKPVMEMKPHKPQYITIHHTGMPQKPELSVEEKLQALQNFSQKDSPMADGSIKKAWPDVPYHFYIATNGEIAEGRDINFQGDSNTNYDLEGHVLIVVEGDFNKEKVLPQQWESLKELVSYISSEYNISRETISGHKDQAETTCPGQDLYQKITQLK